jgi:peptidoglycan/LPS O-acetylase OafA/YrhL
MDGSLWTIQYEFRCYLLIMALGMLRLLRFRTTVALLFVLATVGYTMGWSLPDNVWVKRVAGGVGPEVFRFLSFYLAGTTFYVLRDYISNRTVLAAASAIAVAGSFFYLPAMPAALAICGTYLIFWFAFTKYVPLSHFAKYGDFSYGIYLYAFPIQQIIVATFGARMSPLKFFLMAMPCTVLAGVLSWYAVERWFLRKKSK